jgi:hypothetical protein
MTYERMKQQSDDVVAKRCDQLAQQIIDACIESVLFRAVCSENENHDCVVIWSSGAKEQIAAIIAKGKPSRCFND